jgi:hypothetical protein
VTFTNSLSDDRMENGLHREEWKVLVRDMYKSGSIIKNVSILLVVYAAVSFACRTARVVQRRRMHHSGADNEPVIGTYCA